MAFVPKFAWDVPCEERATALASNEDMLELYLGELDEPMLLKDQAEVWCWLHNLIAVEECAERLAQEACDHLELETGHTWPLDA